MERDFSLTGEFLECGLSALQNALAALFNGDAEFVSVRLGAGQLPNQRQLALASQRAADEVPEYPIQGLGSYLRVARDPDAKGPVALAERAMLDVYTSTFAELAAYHMAKITDPPPPRYCGTSLLGSSELH